MYLFFFRQPFANSTECELHNGKNEKKILLANNLKKKINQYVKSFMYHLYFITRHYKNIVNFYLTVSISFLLFRKRTSSTNNRLSIIAILYISYE